MEAPKKIYLNDSMSTDTIGELWPEWFDDKVSDRSIEYIRKDVVDNMLATAEDHAYFAGSERAIEKFTNTFKKACEWIKQKWDDSYTMPITIDSVIEDFKKYIERN